MENFYIFMHENNNSRTSAPLFRSRLNGIGNKKKNVQNRNKIIIFEVTIIATSMTVTSRRKEENTERNSYSSMGKSSFR